MTVTLEDPKVIAEIEELMARFQMSAASVVEAVIVEAGVWMPMEILGYRRRGAGRGFVFGGC